MRYLFDMASDAHRKNINALLEEQNTLRVRIAELSNNRANPRQANELGFKYNELEKIADKLQRDKDEAERYSNTKTLSVS